VAHWASNSFLCSKSSTGRHCRRGEFRREPGYIGVLEDDQIPAVIFSKLSVHQIGLADLISVAKLKGVMPSKICVIGMQPSSIDFALGLEMSDVVNANMIKRSK